MRKLLVFILAAFLTQVTLAETDTLTPKPLSIKVGFSYQENGNNQVNRYVLNNQIQMKSNDSRWKMIQASETPSQNNPIIVLSKIGKWDAKAVTIAFLVLDTRQSPIIISKPKLAILYGQKGKITIQERNSNIELTVLTNVIKAA